MENRHSSVQGAAGNLAVQRLLHSGAIQARLAVNQPNDRYEQEADRIAEQVVRTEPGAWHAAVIPGPLMLRRVSVGETGVGDSAGPESGHEEAGDSFEVGGAAEPGGEAEVPAEDPHAEAVVRLNQHRREVASLFLELATLHAAFVNEVAAAQAGGEVSPESWQRIRAVEGRLRESLEGQALSIEAVLYCSKPAATPELATAEETRRRWLTDEMEAARRDAGILDRIFDAEMPQFMQQYQPDALQDCDCMDAAYQGIGALSSEAEAEALRALVADKAAEAKAHMPKSDINQFFTVMETAAEQGIAGPSVSTHFVKATQSWDPSVEELVMSQLNSEVPGFFAFGMALADAVHSVMLIVDTAFGPSPVIYWCDQFGCKIPSGGLDEHVRTTLDQFEDQGILTWTPRETRLWPLLPPSARE